MITGVRTKRATNAVGLFLFALIVAGCGRQRENLASPPGPAPLAVRLDYLQHLGLDAVVNGRPVRVVALYANAPDYRPTGSPARDGYEGIACLDDAARAAVVYLRAYEATGDARARDEAVGLLGFVVAMEQGDGEFVNFIDARGRPNRDAPSSRKSLSYWGARSIWALGEAVRVLGPRGGFGAVGNFAPGARPCGKPDGARGRCGPSNRRIRDGDVGSVARSAGAATRRALAANSRTGGANRGAPRSSHDGIDADSTLGRARR